MPYVREQSGGTTELTSYYRQNAAQVAVTYTATDAQDIIIFCWFTVYAGTSTIVAGGNTVYSNSTAGEALFTSTKIHLSAGDTVVASGNSAQYLGIATSGTGTIQ